MLIHDYIAEFKRLWLDACRYEHMLLAGDGRDMSTEDYKNHTLYRLPSTLRDRSIDLEMVLTSSFTRELETLFSDLSLMRTVRDIHTQAVHYVCSVHDNAEYVATQDALATAVAKIILTRPFANIAIKETDQVFYFRDCPDKPVREAALKSFEKAFITTPIFSAMHALTMFRVPFGEACAPKGDPS